MLVEKYNLLIAEGRPIPDDSFSVGELVRRKRPAMGVRR